MVGGCFNVLIAIVLRTCNECKKTNVFCDTKIRLISLPAKKNGKKIIIDNLYVINKHWFISVHRPNFLPI